MNLETKVYIWCVVYFVGIYYIDEWWGPTAVDDCRTPDDDF